jgi:sulfate adenylyltransferase
MADSTHLIPPHGGTLVDRFLRGEARERALERAAGLPRVALSERSLADLECLATGIYSPLRGFVSEADYTSIVRDMRLADGTVWSIPITLQVREEEAAHLSVGSEIALVGPGGEVLAVMELTDLYRPDQAEEARRVYRTDDPKHPGVAAVMAAGSVYLGGPIAVIAELPKGEFDDRKWTPAETRTAFAERGWETVVAFQTRNPIHRAHEYITKTALESVDGLFINPLVGTTKSDDVPASVRMQCYEVLIDKYYNKEKVFLGVYPAAMRYGGPREAILHAISRQNYGCTHLIVGRDHAGVGDYYGTYDAQRIFDELPEGGLEITPMKFEHAFFCKRTQQMATPKTTSSTPEERVHLSGTKVRALLASGQLPPPEFSRPEVAEILVRAYRTQKEDAQNARSLSEQPV